MEIDKSEEIIIKCSLCSGLFLFSVQMIVNFYNENIICPNCRQKFKPYKENIIGQTFILSEEQRWKKE